MQVQVQLAEQTFVENAQRSFIMDEAYRPLGDGLGPGPQFIMSCAPAVLQSVVVHTLASTANQLESIRRCLLNEGVLSAGRLVNMKDVEIIIGECEPESGLFDPIVTEVVIDAQGPIEVFHKIHVLPVVGRHSAAFMYFENVKPYFQERQAGKFSTGYEFAYDGVRFRVVGVEPEDTYGVVGRGTEIYCSGPPLESVGQPSYPVSLQDAAIRQVPGVQVRHPYSEEYQLPTLRRVWVHRLDGVLNEPESIRQTLREQGQLMAGRLVSSPSVEFVIGICEPLVGCYSELETEVIVADNILPVFEKVHVLPFKRTLPTSNVISVTGSFNPLSNFHRHVEPFFARHQNGTFGEGYEFAFDGITFKVVGVLPPQSIGVVGRATHIFGEGQPI